MSLLAFRTAIVTGFTTALPAVKDIKEHAGRFDEAEIKRFATAAPAVRVALLELGDVKALRSGEAAIDVRCGAFIATKDTQAQKRDKGALAIVGELAKAIPENTWGLEYAQNPKTIRASNLYSGSIDRLGIALWAITWNQQVHLGGIDPTTLDAFTKFHAEYDVAQTVDTVNPTDDVTLP